MKHMHFAVAALALALAGSPAFAQSSSGMSSGTQSPSGMSSGTSSQTGVGGSGAFSGWLSDYQTQHQGRISRKAYMDEVGRRWDMADKDKGGLTTDQINQTYGMSGDAPGGTSTAPGNMGPNNVKK